jgi:hypothetical protein
MKYLMLVTKEQGMLAQPEKKLPVKIITNKMWYG